MDAYDSDSAGSGVIDLEAPEWANTNGVGGGSRANNAGARRPKKRSNWRGDPGVDKRKGGAKKKPRNESGVAEPDVEVQSDFSSWRKKGPPPTITFSTALGMETPEHWMTKQGAKDAADCRPSMDCVRLAGSIDLRFSVAEDKASRDIIEQLSPPVYSRRYRVSLGSDQFGIETWNKTGEPTSRGTITVGTLLSWCDDGKLSPGEGVLETLEAMRDLILPDGDPGEAPLPWRGQPLIRVLCPSLLATLSPGGELVVKGYVYLTRLVFFLIAFRPVQRVMRSMTPCVPPRPVRSLPDLSPSVFRSEAHTEHAPDFAFSLAGVMKSIEHTGYRAATQPPGLSLAMKDYQLQTLAWMQDRESLEHGLNELFWEERRFADAGPEYYFAPELGELRLERPEAWRGGILSEEMGMGKTLEILALVQASKLAREEGREKQRQGEGKASEGESVASDATLIVVPNHLVSQWTSEISRCVPSAGGRGGGLTHMCYIHPKDNITGHCAPYKGGSPECKAGACKGYAVHKRERIEQLAGAADVVLTTYQTLEKHKGTLRGIKWARVVLDEMQEIRSSTTELAKACRGLRCQVRWMVSGTPLYTSVDDLNGELAFLGVLPFCLPDAVDGFWGARIGEPFRRQEQGSLELLRVLLGGVMIRHSKSQAYVRGGGSILALPEASNRVVAVEGTPSERYVYAFLEMHAVKELMGVIEGGAEAARRDVRKGATKFWVRVLREASIAPAIVNRQMRDLDARLRSQGVCLAGLLGGAGEEEAGQIRSMEPGEAISMLMQARNVSEVARHHEGNHMVRHDGAQMGIYDRSRNYAMRTVLERLEEVSNTKAELEERIEVAERNVPMLRWKMAMEAVTSGRYLDLKRSSLRQVRRVVARLQGRQEPGMRVQNLRAKQCHAAQSDGQLTLRKGEAVAVCAVSERGWDALGFRWDEAMSLVAACDVACVDRELRGGVWRGVYRVGGRIGLVPTACLEASGRAAAVPQLYAQLKKRCVEMAGEAAIAEVKLREVMPYLLILERAKAAGAGLNASETVDQSGFQQLMEIEQGGAPTCCVCQEGCGLASRPTFMRCAHFACEDCIVQWVRFEQSKSGGGVGGKATCPLCRKQFRLADLVRIVPPKASAPLPAACSSSGGAGGASKRRRGGEMSKQGAAEQPEKEYGAPAWVPAATKEGLEAMMPPPGGYRSRGTIPGSAAFPSLSPQFGAHMYVVTGGETLGKAGGAVPPASSKVVRLLRDLDRVFAAGNKAVVFSQHRHAVTHISRVLSARGVRHARIVRGDPQCEQERAVRDFNEHEGIRVFLLHAGQAAAGLTLTAASHVFLMEPFMKEGEELQAMNRCHRIGQQREVSCRIYYTPGTVEERMVAYRSFENNDDAEPLSVLDHEGDGGMLDTPAKLKFLLGVADGDAPQA